MQKVGLFYAQDREKSCRLAEKIASWLVEQGKDVERLSNTAPSGSIPELDLIISIGGDGSLLKLASLLQERSMPVVGINAGKLGFLTNIIQRI